MKSKRLPFPLMLLALAAFLIACQPETVTVEVTREVVQTETVTEQVEVTRMVEGEVVTTQVEVTRVVEPTPEAIPQGGDIIESTFADASGFNPVTISDQASNDVANKLFLGLVALEEFTGRIVGQVAEDWKVSDDGLTYTFDLRDDIQWSDGTPLTAHDVAFTFDAINADSVASPRRSNFTLVDSWTAVDDYTLEIQLSSIDCTILGNLGTGIIPAHVYDNDVENIADSDEQSAPTVVAGPFMFEEWVADDHVTLVANDNYYLGRPNIDTWTRRVYADESSQLAGFLAGEDDTMSRGTGPQFVSVIEGRKAQGEPIDIRKWFSNGNTFIGFNLANPENPQNGWDDLDGDGKWTEGEPPLEQDPHPVLGDVNVRRAIATSIDYSGIINRVAFGQGGLTLANTWPSIEWAYNNDVAPYEQDLEAATAILDEAGWVDSDDDGVRDKDGQPLAFSLMTNAGNETRENIATLTKDVLDSLGFDITLEFIEFGTVVGKLLGQEYDAVVIGFGGGAPEPDDSSQFSYKNDEVGAGFNFVSYYNEQVEANLDAGKAVPSCDEADRASFYQENQKIMHDDVPYAWLYVPLANGVWRTDLQNYDPNTWNRWYNIQDWFLSP